MKSIDRSWFCRISTLKQHIGYWAIIRSVPTMLLFSLLSMPVSLLANEEDFYAPPAPVLTAPADNEIATGTSYPPLGVPMLSWEPVEGATQYRVEISASAGFANPIIRETTYATTYTPETALADGVYYWRVQAAEGVQWGPFPDSPWSFTKKWSNDGEIVPELLSPANGSGRSAFTNEDFSWTSVPGAAHYLLEIGLEPSLANPEYTARTSKTHHTPTERFSNVLYYWQVTPVDHGGNLGSPSRTFHFTFRFSSKYDQSTGGLKDAPPVLLSPQHNVDLKFVPEFSWTAVESAATYILEISTDREFNSLYTVATTHNTAFTPEKAFANDQDYYWRVKAIDVRGVNSQYSVREPDGEYRKFRAKWDLVPKLLTPPNNSVHHGSPYFRWTPVAGVERYQIQVDESTSFELPLVDLEIHNAAHAGVTITKDPTIHYEQDYFWRVRAIDAQDNKAPWSDTFSFRYEFETSPNPIYPPPYYEPDAENLKVHHDNTIAWPQFLWNTAHVWDPYPLPNAAASFPPDYYVLTVSTSDNFSSPNFQIETRGLGAAPTLDHPFENLEDNTIYYWRVQAIRNGQGMGKDAIGRFRLDTANPQLPFTDTMKLIYPADGFEAVGDAPMLGWLPVHNATHYRLQISHTRDFSDIVEEVEPQFVNYVPWQGQRTAMPYGTYWWRVRAENATYEALTDWSEIRHFNLSLDVLHGNPVEITPLAYPDSILDTNVFTVTTGFPPVPQKIVKYKPEWTYIARSSGRINNEFGLGKLHAMLTHIDLRSSSYPADPGSLMWTIAFETATADFSNTSYGLYIDIDHLENSGAMTDPLSRPIQVDPLYLPEYVLYLQPNSSSLVAEQVRLFSWNGSNWRAEDSLDNVGGDAWFDQDSSTIQLLIPYTAIRSADENSAGSIALTVFSTSDGATDGMKDTIPAQDGTISRPALISDMVMPLFPFDTPFFNPHTYLDMPALVWRIPYFDSVDGFNLEVAEDAKFTKVIETWTYRERDRYPFFEFLTGVFHTTLPMPDNESYYWRVSIRHEQHGTTFSDYDDGPWSPAMRFKLGSRRVSSPRLSTGDLAETTPTFSWDRVEGAAGYVLQVDNDEKFSAPLVVNKLLDGTSFTPDKALPDGTYFWRVAIRRSDKVFGEWTPTMSFVKQSLTPKLVAPINGIVLNEQPTFSWGAILTPTDVPRVAAPLYKLQVDDDPGFSNPKIYITDATLYTPQIRQFGRENLSAGQWYWRVAAVDAAGNTGTYSEPQDFYVEYLPPNLQSPEQGSVWSVIPEFRWAPMDGAAYYEFQLSADENFSAPKTIRTDSVRYTPNNKIDGGVTYYWRVRMYDGADLPGPYVVGRVALERSGYSIGNYVWLDKNNNGQVDKGEPPVPDGVFVELMNASGIGLGKTTRTIDGFYTFDGLSAGSYRVRIMPNNFSASGLLFEHSHSTGSKQESDPNLNVDQVDNGLEDGNLIFQGIISGIITLDGDEPLAEAWTQTGNPGEDGRGTPDNRSNLTVDFGIVPPASGQPGSGSGPFIYLPMIRK